MISFTCNWPVVSIFGVDRDHWGIPDYVEQLNFVGQFPEDRGMKRKPEWPARDHLIERVAGPSRNSPIEVAPLNGSQNPGFDACCRQGLISDVVRRELVASQDAARYATLTSCPRG